MPVFIIYAGSRAPEILRLKAYLMLFTQTQARDQSRKTGLHPDIGDAERMHAKDMAQKKVLPQLPITVRPCILDDTHTSNNIECLTYVRLVLQTTNEFPFG